MVNTSAESNVDGERSVVTGADDRAHAEKLNVFISYSRADARFADDLADGLELAGFETRIDRQSIVEGEDWKRRLSGLITECDVIVFVISPDSIGSSICKWEIAEANRLSKRILPVLWRQTGDIPIPSELSALHYVRFDQEVSFVSALKKLSIALNTDLSWLRNHTRLLTRALEWEAAGRPSNRLLIGEDIDKAKDWLEKRPKLAAFPTSLHLEFISASERRQAEQNDESLRQLREREALVGRAELALKERAVALTNEASARRRVTAVMTVGSILSIGLAVVAGAFALSAQEQTSLAQDNARKAAVAQNFAEVESAKLREELGILRAQTERELQRILKEAENVSRFVTENAPKIQSAFNDLQRLEEGTRLSSQFLQEQALRTKADIVEMRNSVDLLQAGFGIIEKLAAEIRQKEPNSELAKQFAGFSAQWREAREAYQRRAEIIKLRRSIKIIHYIRDDAPASRQQLSTRFVDALLLQGYTAEGWAAQSKDEVKAALEVADRFGLNTKSLMQPAVVISPDSPLDVDDLRQIATSLGIKLPPVVRLEFTPKMKEIAAGGEGGSTFAPRNVVLIAELTDGS